jgi:hypothetical protein
VTPTSELTNLRGSSRILNSSDVISNCEGSNAGHLFQVIDNCHVVWQEPG